MLAPACRFPTEPRGPVIPPREASTMLLAPDEELQSPLGREKAEAASQIAYIRQMLADIRIQARKALR